MSGVYGFCREAVRIKVRKFEGSSPLEYRKFSVDPQITSFEVLQSLLDKAFDIKGEFTICYRVSDNSNQYLPLLSDLDLEAAFLKADNVSISNNMEPCLCLRVEIKPFDECSEEWEQRNNKASIITQFKNYEPKGGPRLHGIINQMGKTFNLVQRSLNFGEDNSISLHPPRQPLSDTEFRQLLDPGGHIKSQRELRTIIYFGGIDPSLRKVLWKHILNVYPDGMNGRERMDYIKRKATEYMSLRKVWKEAINQGLVAGELAYTTSMVKKDVLRTDRHHPFYAGSDDNQNIASLFNILTTFALNHPKVSYCQGMSDLASPLLVTMGDEAHAYICFCALMSRLNSNFMMDGIAMTQKFTHLAEGLMHYDADFYNYLKQHQADDLLFCYRWLLLEMKREFAFDDSLRMLEVLWSSLPFDPPLIELKLFDVIFQPCHVITPPPISPLVKTPRENPYTKVCALRRQSSSISLVNYNSGKIMTRVRRQNHSLDETIGRCKGGVLDLSGKHKSLDDAIITQNKKFTLKEVPKGKVEDTLQPKNELRPRSVSPVEPKSDSVLLLNNNKLNNHHHKVVGKSKSAGLSSSMTNLLKNTRRTGSGHFQGLKERLVTSSKIGIFSSLDTLDDKKEPSRKDHSSYNQPRTRMVKNLNEFLHFAAVNKNKISDKLNKLSSESITGDKPKITLTKSSVDDVSESSSVERNSMHNRHCSSTSTNSYDDTFDDYSPDDSQEYFPMTTSVTRELKIEMENLDRQVFGNKYTERLLESDSHSSDCGTDVKSYNDDNTQQEIHEDVPNRNSDRMDIDYNNIELPSENIIAECDLPANKPTIRVNQQRHSKEDVFLWENPLHDEPSPNAAVKPAATAMHFLRTPDEQADLDLDLDDDEVGQIVDEQSAMKTVTPIKVVHMTSNAHAEKLDKSDLMTRSCRERVDEDASTTSHIDLMSASCTKLDYLRLQESSTHQNRINICEEITESQQNGKPPYCSATPTPTSSTLLPPPNEFGGGNPFLMFLCIAVLLQHREQIVRSSMDYNEMAMHFDKMVRKHDVIRVLNHARQLHSRYMKQHLIVQQQKEPHNEGC